SVYLDKNADGDFTDAGELIHRWNGYGGNSFTLSSPGTVWGWSRIRVVMSYGGYASSCGGGYGETEDISVYLRPAFIIIWPWMQPAVSAPLATSAQQRGNQPLVAAERPVEMPRVGETAVRETMLGGPTAVKVFPNPANAGARLTVTGLTTNSFALRDFRGRVLATYPVNDTVQHITLPTTLPAGIYLLGQQRIVVR
ncbi:MAG: T9SS type A sorting domain-containing protein, partial [Bacteroidota bacterium]